MKEELWIDIPNYEGIYKISSKGSIMSNHKGSWRIIQPSSIPGRYQVITLYNKGQNKAMTIHRLVAEAFIPNPKCYPIINHKDENKHNNAVSNLEWCTHKYNSNYGACQTKKTKNIDYSKEIYKINAVKNGQKVSVKVSQYTKDGILINTYNSIKEAGRLLKIDSSHIGDVCRNKRKSAGGFIWKYETPNII